MKVVYVKVDEAVSARHSLQRLEVATVTEKAGRPASWDDGEAPVRAIDSGSAHLPHNFFVIAATTAAGIGTLCDTRCMRYMLGRRG